jgi:hypothetical protein
VQEQRAPARGHIAQRVAWLLRVNRSFGGDESSGGPVLFPTGAAFAAAFTGGCWPGTVDASTISRWETGKTRVPYLAVRRYEELLGLQAHLLVSTIDTVHRYSSGRGAFFGPGRDEGGDGAAGLDDAEDLLDAAMSGALMTGFDWDRLSSALSADSRVVLMPRPVWGDISGRLIAEMVVADGLAWTQRFEALNRFLAHRSGQRAAVDACASLGADRASQVIVEAVSALDGSAHPDASRHVLAQLRSPTSDLAFYGALLACVRKIQYRHFADAELSQIAAVATDLLTGPRRHDDAQPLAAEVFRLLPPGLRQRASQRLRSELAAGPAVTEVLATGRLGSGTAPLVRDRVAGYAMAHVDRDGTGCRDGMLPGLLDEVLFSPVLDVRLYTAMLIRATPYRAPLAWALAAELAKPDARRDAGLAATIIGCLRITGGPPERPAIERLILAPGIPESVTVAAAHAIGHVGGVSGDQYWAQALGHHARQWRRHGSAATGTVLHDLVYGLGMGRNDRLLAAVRDDAEAPQPVRAAASWWLGLPRQVQQSARF